MFDAEAFQMALSLTFSWQVFLWLFVGILLGIVVGSIPGLTSDAGVALMLPLAFYLGVAPALALLIGLYKGATFGGSISAILFSVPGVAGSVATLADGYKMTSQGKGRKALDMALGASVTGDLLSDFLTILIAPALAIVALSFGPTERFLLITFAFLLIGFLAGDQPYKGLLSATIGLLLASIGGCPVTFRSRLTFGIWWLEGGVGLLPLIIGLFAMSRMIMETTTIMAQKAISQAKKLDINFKDFIKGGPGLTLKEFIQCWRELLLGTGIGSFVGMLPGLGASVGAILSYAAAKKISRKGDQFGEGALEGIAAAEAGNNATVGPTLIPLLTLGIPGNVIAALIGGALMMKGITPSPRMFELFPDVVYALFMILILGNFVNLILGKGLMPFFAMIGNTPKSIMVPFISVMAIMGTYVVRGSIYDVILMFIIALIGYIFLLTDIPFPPLIMSFILAPLLELNLRQGIMIARGDIGVMLQSTLSKSIVILVAILFFFVVRSLFKKKPI